MKILLVGLGSIGKRHLRNIRSLGYNKITVVSRKDILPEEFSEYPVFSSVAAALAAAKFDAAIICTPTAMHIQSLQTILNAGMKQIYLEKPVSHNYEQLEEIKDQIRQTGARIMVGYDLHYDLGLQKVKELLSSNTIGNIISVNAQVGQYLPDWRPGQDYREGMSAKKETGGGVMLDLVHEFDYLYWLFGEVKTIACQYRNTGTLGIETEDVAEVLLHFKNNIIGTIHLDYLQQQLVRNCMITGSVGTISWDLSRSAVKWIDAEKKERSFDYKGFERNNRFMNIMKDFLEEKQNDNITGFEQGLTSLKMVLAAKYSSEHNVFVKIDSYNPPNI